MEKLRGFAVVGFPEDGFIHMYSFKHWHDAIEFLNLVKDIADIGWEVHEFNDCGGVSAAVESFKRSMEAESE